MRRPVTYKDAVQRLLNLGFCLEDMMIEMLQYERCLTGGLKQQHWFATRDADGSHILQVLPNDRMPLSFRVEDLARYRSLLLPEVLK